MSNQQNTQSKQCNRCGEEIIWNTNMGKFETVGLEGWQHNCKLGCKTEGCTNPVFFSNVCPKNATTGRSQPLAMPIPVDGADGKKYWMLHVHSNAKDQTQKMLPVTGDIVEEKTQAAPTTVKQNPYMKQEKTTAVAGANKDVNDAIVTVVNEMNQRLGHIEEYMNQVLVPDHKELMTLFKEVAPNLKVITGAIVKGSFETAEDILKFSKEQASKVQSETTA